MSATIAIPARTILQHDDFLRWEAGEKVDWIDEIWEVLDSADEDYKRYKVELEPKTMGSWVLIREDIPKRCFARLHNIAQGSSLDRDTGYGDTTILMKDGVVWMSDTRAEIMEHTPLINKLWYTESLRPRVLINGLGIGMAVKAALLHGASHVDVVEIDEDIIKMVGPKFADDPRVTIHHDDAMTIAWGKNVKWSLAWHDIWPYISAKNIPEMDALHKKYRRRVNWQASWQRKGCLDLRRKETELVAALKRGDWDTVKRIDPDF